MESFPKYSSRYSSAMPAKLYTSNTAKALPSLTNTLRAV